MLHGLVRCRLPSAVCRQAGHCNFSLQFLKKKILKKNSHCNFSTNQAHRSTANSQRIRDTALSSTEEVFNLSWGPYCKYLMLPQCLSHEHTVSLTNTLSLSRTHSDSDTHPLHATAKLLLGVVLPTLTEKKEKKAAESSHVKQSSSSSPPPSCGVVPHKISLSLSPSPSLAPPSPL